MSPPSKKTLGRKTSNAASEALAGAPPATASDAVDEQLARYRAMRDFSTTAEPSGGHENASPAPETLPFVIQKHAATRLHYDFRLGWRGVLKSWAVAKGPSYVTRDRRLAVEVEDHPMEYGGFEGTIPKGQYGGGTVLVWDEGTWEPHGDVDEGLRKGSLKFALNGHKLHGNWTLVRMGGKGWGAKADAKPNWLLIKEHDQFERHEGDPPITETAPDSVVTGRSLEQIADAEDHVWNSKPSAAKPPANRSRLAKAHLHSTVRPRATAAPKPAPHTAAENETAPRHAALDSAPQEAMPGFLAPQLATAAHAAPAGRDWLYELKLDGYRVQIHIAQQAAAPRVTIYTRNGLDWTHRMPGVAEACTAFASRAGIQAAILDGEVVVLNAEGGSSFSDLQAAFDEGARHPMTFFAFDLLHLNIDGAGHNLRGLPLRERKALLQGLLHSESPTGTLRYSEDVAASGTGPAAEIFERACTLGAEGMIAKLGGSRYLGGRYKDWLKLKCVRRQEFVIGGFTLPGDGGEGLGSLLLGYYSGAKLVHCGRTGTGFTQSTQRMLRKKLEALRTPKSPYASPLTALARKDAIWVRPELVCEVEFATWTKDGLVRHASFQGLREDKAPKEVVQEDTAPAMKPDRGKALAEPEVAGVKLEPASAASAANPGEGASENDVPEPARPATKAPAKSSASRTPATSKAPSVIPGKPRLTHPEKILDEASGVTKQQLALYYEEVAPAMLPHIADRPLSIVRCPEGSTHPCFFQKHAGQGLSPAVGSVPVPDKKTGKPEQYITVDTTEGLVSLAQIGVLEVHPWGSHNGALDRPDRLIFDLDPDEALPWPKLVESARTIRTFLEELKLQSFVKTTGGKGLHLVVPIAPTIEWPQIKLFCRGIAAAIESSDPKLYLIKMTKAARKGRIFLDYLRNERGSTAIAPYSPRARAGMRVAVPLDWSELDAGMPTFSVANFDTWRSRLRHDPWAKMTDTTQMTHSVQTVRPEILSAVLDQAGK